MHLTSAVIAYIPMANNEFILLCTIFAHLFPLTDYSFFSPPSSSVWEIPFLYVYTHTLYISCFLLHWANTRVSYYSQCCELLSKHFLLLIQKSSRSFSLQSENNHKIFIFFFSSPFIKSQSYIYWNWLEIGHWALPMQVYSLGLGD